MSSPALRVVAAWSPRYAEPHASPSIRIASDACTPPACSCRSVSAASTDRHGGRQRTPD
ncbi:hypothetical protein [Enterobacter kobei]|uniref:hypothetical protein n=1 Tax=Enterobacter kobei TaxID=208224 RepID=UPI0015F47C30|nr:hypothetical protein [Enterobacter kobei]